MKCHSLILEMMLSFKSTSTKNVFIVLVIITVLLSIAYIPNDLLPTKLLKPWFQPTILLLRHNGTSDKTLSEVSYFDEKFLNLTKVYDNKLASIPRHQYSPADTNLYIGAPISTVYDVSRDPLAKAQHKLILLWTPWFGRRDWRMKNETLPGCPVFCEITTNKSDLLRSGAVVFSPRDMQGGKKILPKTRLPWQRWIYWIRESPFHTGIKLSDYNDVFNWTATLRLDSDIYVGHIGFDRRQVSMEKEKFDSMLSQIVTTKSRLVAARISNCDRRKTKRLAYIAELKKYIPVDFYGGCGDMKFPKGQEEGDELLRTYKFYLSFENSNCRDYITEKFALPLYTWQSVPVVLGAAPEDYLALAPNRSFINTAGFNSPKELADYLRLLDEDTLSYKRYFEWHRYWQLRYSSRREAYLDWPCAVCRKMYNLSLPIKSYRNFRGWYREDYCNL